MNYSDALIVDFAPIDHGDITGVARVVISFLHHANMLQDLFLIRNLESFHRASGIPEYIEISLVLKGALKKSKSFDEIRNQLRDLPTTRIPKKSLSNSRILYPLWRPASRISNQEFLILYDFSTMRFSETHSVETVQRFTKNLEYATQLGTKCICISKTTMRDAIKYSAIEKKNMKVIYCGLNPFLDIGLTIPKVDLFAEKLSKEVIKFLFISTLEPRKRIIETLEWWIHSEYNNGENHLTVIGGIGWWSPKEFLGKLAKLRKSLENSSVTFTGYVDEDQMANFLAEASVLLYPSKYEGFGLPVQDALVFGVPVLAAANSALLEFHSEMVEFVHGDQTELWDWKLTELLSRNQSKSVHDFELKYSWSGYFQYIMES